jgi:hypothetical protein
VELRGKRVLVIEALPPAAPLQKIAATLWK